MIPVVWLTLDPDVVMARGFWDQAIVEDLLAGKLWRPPCFPEFVHLDALPADGGAVVVLPGSYHRDRVPELNALLAPLPWVLLIVTEDEGSAFPWGEVAHSNLRRWVQTPRRDRHDDTVRRLPVGWTPATGMAERQGKSADWFFAGQVTQPRRVQCAEQLRQMPGGQCVETAGFTQGLDPADYMRQMSAAKVAPCPAGQVTPDSFRVWEALELGCVPVVDVKAGEWDVPEYWEFLLGGTPPFPLIEDWADLPGIVELLLEDWPAASNRVQSWWQGYKRRLAYRLVEDLRDLGAPLPEPETADLVTVLVPTSPIPSHPDTAIIAETLDSVRKQAELAGCEIVVMVDGVRDEQSLRQADYDEYVRRLLEMSRDWDNVWVRVFDGHHHQSGMTRVALGDVSTAAVLFVEHDAPLVGDIPWDGLVEAVRGPADLVRLHHEASVLEPHRGMMLDVEPQQVCGVPMLRTVQFSARPHLANAGWYRRAIAEHFKPDERWMLEDRFHSVVECAWRDFGLAGWERFRLWMYAPEGDMKRSTHLDGRGSDEKWVDR